MAWGQQVSDCVEVADYVLVNDKPDTLLPEAEGQLKESLVPDLALMRAADIGPVTSELGRPPMLEEVHMATAYTQANQSQCLKRHVGAVIVDQDGFAISTGFNENPRPMTPCKIAYRGNCFKDMDMEEKLRQKGKVYCPSCGNFVESLEQPWKCPRCGANIKLLLFPDRNMQVCTAIHAEERAILSLGGRRLEKESTLYTTTFPCFQCSRKVVDAGIGKVVYVEAYPVVEAIKFLKKNEVTLTPFRGFTARAFHRVFRGVK